MPYVCAAGLFVIKYLNPYVVILNDASNKILCVIITIFFPFLFSHYQSTAGGDLSMLFQLHAGFEPTLPRWLRAGWKGYYISYDTICICAVKVIH